MLGRPAQEGVRISRRELFRLAATAAALIIAMTVILGVDFSPRLDVKVGDLAPTDIRAPRAATFTNNVLTQAARDAARAAVPSQYDYTSESAIATASQQLNRFSAEVAPLDTAFATKTKPADKQALIDAFLPKVSTETGAVLQALKLDRWTAVRTEAARVLDVTERTELRDNQVAITRLRLSEQMAGGLSDGERQLAAELIGPLLVPNSSFSDTLTQQERDRQAAAVAPVIDQIVQGEVIVRAGTKISDVDLERIQALALDVAHPDYAGLAGWFVLSGLLVVLVLGWIWRFRRAFWHRNNVMFLISLLIVLATFALKLTAGRATLPFILPIAAVGISRDGPARCRGGDHRHGRHRDRRRARRTGRPWSLGPTSSSAAWPESSRSAAAIGSRPSSRPASPSSSRRPLSSRRIHCSASVTSPGSSS